MSMENQYRKALAEDLNELRSKESGQAKAKDLLKAVSETDRYQTERKSHTARRNLIIRRKGHEKEHRERYNISEEEWDVIEPFQAGSNILTSLRNMGNKEVKVGELKAAHGDIPRDPVILKINSNLKKAGLPYKLVDQDPHSGMYWPDRHLRLERKTTYDSVARTSKNSVEGGIRDSD